MESRKTLAALLLAAAALQPSPAVRGESACGGNAADTSPVRVLVAPTSCRVPFYVEHNGSVISCDDVCKERPHGVRFGDIVQCQLPYDDWGTSRRPIVKGVTVIGHDEGGTPQPISADEFYKLEEDLAFVAVTGTVFDVCKDYIDSRFGLAFLDAGGKTIRLSFGICEGAFPGMKSLVGCEVIAMGVVDKPRAIHDSAGGRRFPGLELNIGGADNCRVLRQPAHDGQQAPDLGPDIRITPDRIAAIPLLRVVGTVLGAWQKNNVMIACASGGVCRAELATEDLPEAGAAVELVGRPETDLFDINLVRASWKPSPEPPLPEPEPAPMEMRRLFETKRGEAVVNSAHRGKILSVCGTVKSIALDESGNRCLLARDGAHTLNVICGASAGLPPSISEGCRVRVTGVCVMDSDHWRPQVPLPAVRGMFLVVRRTSDIVVTGHPPWWTPLRVAIVAFFLFAMLVGIAAWNIALHRKARRLGAEIAEGELSRQLGKLKVAERTRLAAELHDGIVQNLTGVSMEIRSAMMSRKLAPDQLDGHLRMALLSLDSCRDELRDCIWDLHNLTLDESTADEAIQKAVGQHLGGARLSVRFNVPRKSLPDNVFYALIRIIRELVINAARHGHATEIKVAGTAEGGHLHFSVQDNGRGFDALHAPGMEQGHFGLQGISDRVESLGGTFEIDSVIGTGSKAKVELPLAAKGRERP